MRLLSATALPGYRMNPTAAQTIQVKIRLNCHAILGDPGPGVSCRPSLCPAGLVSCCITGYLIYDLNWAGEKQKGPRRGFGGASRSSATSSPVSLAFLKSERRTPSQVRSGVR